MSTSTAAALDTHREVRELFAAAGCRTVRECADLAAAILGRPVGPGRDAITPAEAPLLLRALRDAVTEPKGHDG